MSNKFMLTYMADGSTEEQVHYLFIVGGHAEALEKANDYLNANYYSWEIVDLKKL